MKRLLKIIWQLPQTLIGAILLCILQPDTRRTVYGKRIWYTDKISGSISLGEVIIISMDKYTSYITSTEIHELGHYRQSLILGWWYLPIIGIPSIIHCAIHKGPKYGHFYTEYWADELAYHYNLPSNPHLSARLHQRELEVRKQTIDLSAVLNIIGVIIIACLV